jgi:hypothetical protein
VTVPESEQGTDQPTRVTDGPTAAPAEPTRVGDATPQRLMSGLRTYVTAMLVCFGLVAALWLLTLRSPGEPPTVDVPRVAAQFRAIAPYETYAPATAPSGWRATSSRITGTRAKGPVTWHLGYTTPGNTYAALEESDENPATFVPRMTNRDKSIGTQQVAGATWERYYRPDKKQYSLARRLPGVTLVVTGTAPYDELATLAAALRPQPKS